MRFVDPEYDEQNNMKNEIDYEPYKQSITDRDGGTGDSSDRFGSEATTSENWASVLPLIPDWIANTLTGFGDGVFNAITLPAKLCFCETYSLKKIREFFGFNSNIGESSVAYDISDFAGNVWGGTALYGGVGLAYAPGLGPGSSFIGHPAYGGHTISALRQGLRVGWGRGGSGPVFRAAYRDIFKVDIYKP